MITITLTFEQYKTCVSVLASTRKLLLVNPRKNRPLIQKIEIAIETFASSRKK